jgi:hypothetical protein
MYKISDVAELVGTTANYLRAHIHRKNFMFENGDIAFHGVNGQAIRLSFDGAMRMALFIRLNSLGVKAEALWHMISLFMDFGDIQLTGEPMQRGPGELFSAGETVLVGANDGSVAKIVNVRPNTPAYAFFEFGRPDVFMLNISHIHRGILALDGARA